MRAALVTAFLLISGPSWSTDVTLPDYERVELGNGTVLLLSEKHEVPLIGLRAVIRSGSMADPAGKAGLTELLAAVMQKGAGDRGAAEFVTATANVGGRLSISAGVESIAVSAEFLSRDAELMIELTSDVLLRPTLSEEEFEKERARAVGLIKAAKDSDPNGLMPYYANAHLFGKHPYGSPTIGSEASLEALEQEDLQKYYEDHFGGDRLVISVVGDFDLAAMKARLSAVFGSWGAAGETLPTVTAPVMAPAGSVLLVDKPGATQTYFWLGNIGVAIDYPRRAELDIANRAFGGSFTSMLMTELRVNSGLTYSARSVVDRRSRPGSVMIRSFTETGKTVEAIDLAIEVLGRLHDKGLSKERIASARALIMGQFPTRLETASALADMFAFLELHGLDRSYIDGYGSALEAAAAESIALTISEVYPSADDLVLVLIGDADAIRDDITKYGSVVEMSIAEPRFSAQ